MNSTSTVSNSTNSPVKITGDIVGGALLTILSLIHIYVIGAGGTLGWILLLVLWPILSGLVGASVEHSVDPTRVAELPLIGAIAGVFGAVATTLILLLLGWLGIWSSFIYNELGVDLVTVSLGIAILFTITWTVAGFVGGYVVQRGVKRSDGRVNPKAEKSQ
ncbi:hypothetical protein [Natronorarus salvus]|uniref:hypothetical protein n=1 Tax=Natronorarus salvus TaxID=3117733 RepID=UPI002F268801